MKKSVSRILSLLLTLSLCAGMLLLPAWAAEGEDKTEPAETTTAAEPTEGEPTDGTAAEPAEGEPADAAEPAEGEPADAAEPAEDESADAAEPTEPADETEPAAEPKVSLSAAHDDITITVTAAEKIAVGEEITVSAAGMAEDAEPWSFNIYAEKDNAKRFSLFQGGKLLDFKSFEECSDIIASDEYKENAFIEPNGSATVTLEVPEEYQDWDLAVRVSLPGQVFVNVPFSLKSETGEPETEPAPEKVSFSDVQEGRWYYNVVNTIAAAGWMNGNPDGTFDPTGNISISQVLVIAARIHANSFEKEIAPVEGGPWYTQYVNYCVENGIIAEDAFSEEDMTRAATRFEFIEIMDKAPQPMRTAAMREVADGYIPDLAEADEHGEIVYKWYRAGIIDGNDTHAFNGPNTITRAEAASILCRVMVLVERISE